MKSTKNLIPKVLKENMSDPKEDSKELGNLEEALGKFGIEVTKFRDQYGVDPSKIVEFRETKKGEVILKKNCGIGSHSVIMPGVTIGENSIVGAFSFVNKDVPDNMLAFGIPAKIIKKISNA